MAVFLLGGLIYSIYWASIWDHTSDGLSGLYLTLFGVMTGILAGILLVVYLSRWRRLAGLLFLASVPLLPLLAFQLGWKASYHAITEDRAAAIAAALERHHARTGAYPQALGDLTPRDLPVIPQPVILQGEPWCYQATGDSYRLGAIFREFFAMPLSIRIYASAGQPPDSAWECDARLEELKTLYDADITLIDPGIQNHDLRLMHYFRQCAILDPIKPISTVVELSF
jgi:hypothetical protein